MNEAMVSGTGILLLVCILLGGLIAYGVRAAKLRGR